MDKTKFWDSFEPDRPILTNEMVAFAENILDVKLPKLFIDLLRIKNGGATIDFAFPITKRTAYFVDYVPFSELFGILTEDSILEWQKTWSEQRIIDFHLDNETTYFSDNILNTPYLSKEWGLPEKQIIIAGEGHWWITLDYRYSVIPTVRLIATDEKEDIQIAANFEEFINKLEPEDNYTNGNDR